MRPLLHRVVLVVITIACLVGVSFNTSAAPSPRELSVAVPYDPTDLDLRFHVGVLGKVMLDMIYEPLFRYDQNNNLIPHLVTDWRWIAPTKLQLKLRPNVKFHNGAPFTARDVKFTLETTVDPNLRSRNRPFLSEVQSVDVVDDLTAVINTDAPSRGLVRQLTYYGLIVPNNSRNPGSGVDLSRQPIGTGPFKFVRYSPGERLIVERNDDYWGAKARVDRVVFRIIPDGGTRSASIEAGEVHFALDIPLEAVARLSGRPELAVDTRPTSRVVYLGLRLDKAPTSSLKVRQAIAHAINVDQLNRRVFQGKALPARTILGPNIWGYASLSRYEHDPNRARQLLREAGAEGARVQVMGPRGGFLSDKDVSEVVGGSLQAVGLRVELHILEWATFLNAVFAPDSEHQVWVSSWGVNSLNPDMLMTAEFHSVRGRDRYRYKNPELDDLIDRARAEVDDAKASVLYKRAQEVIWRDLPWVTLYVQPDTIAYRRNLKGWYRTQGDDYVRFWNAFFE